jgi:starvation-inducible DNA-binding protein
MSGLVEELKVLQANVFQLYAQAHGFHWNVEGQDFKQLHAFFLEIYEDVFDSIDGIAENVRKLNDYAGFGAKSILQNASIEINDSLNLSSKDMVKELLITNGYVIDNLNNIYKIANDANEQGICNFLAGRIEKHQFWQWQLRATYKDTNG